MVRGVATTIRIMGKELGKGEKVDSTEGHLNLGKLLL